MEDKVINIKELANYLSCSVSTIRRLVKEDKIPYFRIGVKLYFNLLSIKEWIKENEKR